MRVYQNAFSEAARQTGYSVKRMAKSIMAAFRARAEAAGAEFSDVLIRGAIDGERRISRTAGLTGLRGGRRKDSQGRRPMTDRLDSRTAEREHAENPRETLRAGDARP